MHDRSHFFFVSLLLLGLYALPLPLWAQDVTFTHLTTEDGLSSNVIQTVLQDHRGYLWLGTFGEGLIRYDGYEMKVFRYVDGDSTSLSGDFVNVLYESADGTLWVGAGQNGLNRYDAATETFVVYQHVEGDRTSLGEGSVRSIHESGDGSLWVGMNSGLYRYDVATETFKAYRNEDGNPQSLSHDEVRAVHETRDGTLWIGTDGGGLNRFDPNTETFEVYRHAPGVPTSLSNDRVEALHESRDGTLWVGTLGGLNRFDAATETFEVYRHAPGVPTSLSNDRLRAIHETADGMLWVGTAGNGLNRLVLSEVEGSDATLEKFEAYRHVADDPTSLSNNEVTSIHESTEGILWIGTRGGLNRYDAASETFDVYQHEPGDPTSLTFDDVSALHEAVDGTLWVGTQGGLIRFDVVSETLKAYLSVEGNPTSLSHNEVLSIHESIDGTLWVGTWGGLNRFDAATESFEVYRHAPGVPTSLSNDRVEALHESIDGTLWVGTLGGLNRLVLSKIEGYDAAAETFEVFLSEGGDPENRSNRVLSIHESGNGTLWLGTRGGGLVRFDPTSKTFHIYRHVPGDPASLIHNIVRVVHETADGTLWVGTRGGLDRLEGNLADPASVSFSHVLADTRLGIANIVEDEYGQLWLGLTSGRLARFNPETEQMRYFGRRHGLPVGEFNNAGVLHSRTGILYWGNDTGLISLRPDRLPPAAEPPALHLTEFLLFNEQVIPGPGSPLEQPLWQTEALQLSHAQNDLTFGFVGIHYADPTENRYQYRLLGYDRDWRSETRQRRATYTNLKPGDYTFEVKAANSDGIWTEEPVRLGVEILPPWWRTLWAYGVYGLLFLGAVFLADQVQRRRLIHRERQRAEVEQERLRAEAAERELAQAREIEQAYHQLKTTQVQLVQQEKMASLGQLTAGIAHEIKNPLNFVNNFAEINQELATEIGQALDAGDPDEARALLADLLRNEGVVAQHGKRADAIVRSMMQHASGGTGQRESVDLNALVAEYVDLAYHGKRAQVDEFDAEITRDFGTNMGQVEVIPQEIGRVLLNILSNAFDAVQGRDDPRVTVSTGQKDGHVEIRMSDNGPGIPEEIRDHILEPFFTTKPTGSGTGLGLSLAYDIVTQGHGGTLTVESNEGEGATFVVTLPLRDGAS